MKTLQFEVRIRATKEQVWSVLWEDRSFRRWADLIDEGTYLKGDLVQGQEVQFLSSVNGYGVTSLVKTLRENEYILFCHSADTMRSGTEAREKEWTGGKESYLLTEREGFTALTVQTDIPDEMEELFQIRLPHALEQIKKLAENPGGPSYE